MTTIKQVVRSGEAHSNIAYQSSPNLLALKRIDANIS